ncbi:hypothetical protein [Spirillospora sp. NPDC048823]|uniref:hypothetical protein n=1 Tax=unclassified Spirillospora TaxID=2642701 RepID=UPI003712F5EF
MTINDLRGVLKGRVLLPDDDGFEQAATAWNLTARQPVAAVAEGNEVEVRAEERVGAPGVSVTGYTLGGGVVEDEEGVQTR